MTSYKILKVKDWLLQKRISESIGSIDFGKTSIGGYTVWSVPVGLGKSNFSLLLPGFLSSGSLYSSGKNI